MAGSATREDVRVSLGEEVIMQHVSEVKGVGEACLQHGAGLGIALARPQHLKACTLKPQVKAANPGTHAGDGEGGGHG